jgi:integrase
MASSYFKQAKRLYGTRGAEINKRELQVGKTKVTLYQRKDNGSPCWYFKLRIKGERQYYKRSLKTASFAEAKELAEEKVIALLGSIQQGHKVVSLALADLFRQYRQELDLSVAREQRRPSTVKNLCTRLGHGMRFLSKALPRQLQTKVGEIDGNLFEQYLPWREADIKGKTSSKASLSMIRDELLTIRAAFHWAVNAKLAPERAVPKWTTFKTPEQRRERVTREQYNQVVTLITHWARKKEPTAKGAYYRQLVRHAFLTVSNCGLRSGELFGLKNSDISVDPESQEVVIRVRGETSKKAQDRNTTLAAVDQEEGGKKVNYLIRWLDEFQIHKKPNDFVFAHFDEGSKPSKIYPKHTAAREQFYSLYKRSFRLELKKKGLEWFDLYHCRHIFITLRLQADQNPFKIATATGTSLAQIQKTYSHIQSELASREIQQTRNRRKRKLG